MARSLINIKWPAGRKGKNNKAKQNLENPYLEELASKNCISEDHIVIVGVNIISLITVLDIFLFLVTLTLKRLIY